MNYNRSRLIEFISDYQGVWTITLSFVDPSCYNFPDFLNNTDTIECNINKSTDQFVDLLLELPDNVHFSKATLVVSKDETVQASPKGLVIREYIDGCLSDITELLNYN